MDTWRIDSISWIHGKINVKYILLTVEYDPSCYGMYRFKTLWFKEHGMTTKVVLQLEPAIMGVG